MPLTTTSGWQGCPCCRSGRVPRSSSPGGRARAAWDVAAAATEPSAGSPGGGTGTRARGEYPADRCWWPGCAPVGNAPAVRSPRPRPSRTCPQWSSITSKLTADERLHKLAVGVGHSLQHAQGLRDPGATRAGAVSGPARPAGPCREARPGQGRRPRRRPGLAAPARTGQRDHRPPRSRSRTAAISGPRPGSVLTSAGHPGCRCRRSNVCPFPKSVLVGTTPYDPASRLL
jgi:hypothetical protein